MTGHVLRKHVLRSVVFVIAQLLAREVVGQLIDMLG